MDKQQMFMMLPGMDPSELMVIQSLTTDMTDNQVQQFYSLYQSKRKDPQTILIMTILGFFGVAGIQRFVLGETGMGILYLFTGGLCGIGTILDLINNRKMTSQFNERQATETARMMKMINK